MGVFIAILCYVTVPTQVLINSLGPQRKRTALVDSGEQPATQLLVVQLLLCISLMNYAGLTSRVSQSDYRAKLIHCIRRMIGIRILLLETPSPAFILIISAICYQNTKIIKII